MKKMVRNGQVAVLISPDFGAGWYTWHGLEALLFDPVIVAMVERSAPVHEIETYVDKSYADQEVYMGGAETLTVVWVPQGVKFRIEEYDGSETLMLESEIAWLEA